MVGLLGGLHLTCLSCNNGPGNCAAQVGMAPCMVPHRHERLALSMVAVVLVRVSPCRGSRPVLSLVLVLGLVLCCCGPSSGVASTIHVLKVVKVDFLGLEVVLLLKVNREGLRDRAQLLQVYHGGLRRRTTRF